MLNYDFENRQYSQEEIKAIVSKIISEEELDYLYSFLDENYENMNEKEQLLWASILESIDKNFYENE